MCGVTVPNAPDVLRALPHIKFTRTRVVRINCGPQIEGRSALRNGEGELPGAEKDIVAAGVSEEQLGDKKWPWRRGWLGSGPDKIRKLGRVRPTENGRKLPLSGGITLNGTSLGENRQKQPLRSKIWVFTVLVAKNCPVWAITSSKARSRPDKNQILGLEIVRTKIDKLADLGT
ncbi:hypothetical protein R3P38DRAFT_2787422 [Favolaschia claudopus]|uniref:Uncharacterized protein n=1 Tax=Favolaschia claudopus TaxID=2862362 RepID=A0AAW0APF7_9AGAR